MYNLYEKTLYTYILITIGYKIKNHNIIFINKIII